MKILLKPKQPYSFDLHLKSFSFIKPQPEVYKNGIWKRALRLNSGKLVALEVRSIGSVEKPKLEANILSRISQAEKKELKNKLSWIFNTKANLTELYNFMEKDPILKELGQKLYGLRPFNYPTVFEGLIKSIIQQQISLIGSMHITSRLIERFGKKVEVGKEGYYEFPSPQSLAKTSIEDLKKCGLSKQKSSYIQGLSKKIIQDKIDLEQWKELPSERTIEKLMGFKGVGRWTAELTVVTSTGKDALPADDLGARRAVSKFYFKGKLIGGERLRAFSNKWGKFRGIMTYYLICAERTNLIK